MSSEALAWAFKQDVKPSAVKFTLIALCECANYKTGAIHPSIAHIEEITGQNRKTIIANIAKLEALGFIVDSGERSGKTRQIKVYQIAVGTVPETEQSLERNSSINDEKQSQKRDTEPSSEPSSSSKTTSSQSKPGAKPDEFPCPDGCDEIDWQCLLDTRKRAKKPMSLGAYRQIIKKLEGWARDGWPPGPILANAVERGWLTVFETEEMKARTNGNYGKIISGSPAGGSDKRDGVAKALDRRLGFDDAAGASGRRDAGQGQGYSPLAIAEPNSMR